ncbi:MAG: redox-regulated ATPase YchF, partial [Erysipelotrichaceae bacterium]|nr:redox-regulated ATPase YchF [Erysipelotrichaceae bacterium]
MPLTTGIVGLPNVGKSTLFNAITKSQVEAANYPFATISPNVGTVEVPDERMDRLVEMFNPRKTIYTTFEFTDIAGLVKGASKGEGLGNQFLSNIRECDAICHVVRCFENADITHVEGDVDPIRDIEIINLELIFADLATVENRITKVERKAQVKDKDAVFEFALLKKIQETLMAEKPVRSMDLEKEEWDHLKSFNLLTSKPVIYIANMSEDEVAEPD